MTFKPLCKIHLPSDFDNSKKAFSYKVALNSSDSLLESLILVAGLIDHLHEKILPDPHPTVVRTKSQERLTCCVFRDGEKGENHSSLCVLAMKAWLGLGRYGGTEKDMKETIKDDVKDSVTWPVRIAILILAGDYRYTSSLEVLLALRLQTYMNE
ncbi:hypothetical protein Tco_0741928 [Tanacetum coccineum]